MSVQKILPLARKIGEKNFLSYKEFIKNAKNLQPGETTKTSLRLKNMTIIDTVNFTLNDNAEKVDIEGFKNLLREIHKMYFPRAADKNTTKFVTMTYSKTAKDASTTELKVFTDDKYRNAVGCSFYKFIKKGKEVIVDINTYCEDFKLKLQANANLKNADINKKQNLSIGANWQRDLEVAEKDGDVIFSLNALPNEDVPKFDIEASISKDKLESMFNGGFEKALPDLIEKSGFKL